MLKMPVEKVNGEVLAPNWPPTVVPRVRAARAVITDGTNWLVYEEGDTLPDVATLTQAKLSANVTANDPDPVDPKLGIIDP